MSEGFDLSDIPLACDTQSELDSTSELVAPSVNSTFNHGSDTCNEPSDESNMMTSSEVDNDQVINCVPKKTEAYEENATKIKKDEETWKKSMDKEKEKENGFEEMESNCHSYHSKEKLGQKMRTEEEIKLREFDLLDEVGPYDDGDVDEKNNSCSDDDEYDDDDDDDEDDDLSEDEIDAMLEERLIQDQPLPKKMRFENSTNNSNEDSADKNLKSGENLEYTKKEKTVLVEKVRNHFEVIPDGWVSLTHNSGMPLYLHRNTRVCTLSKPYSLGPGSARKHAIPLSAIPCLEYRRAKEEEAKRNAESKNSVLIVNGTEIPNARVETAQENETSRQLTPEQLTEYCKSLFDFETVQVFRFKSWVARRKFKKKKNDRIIQRPTLPKDTKLITCPLRQPSSCGKSVQTREWIMNPNGKSYVCILHEYVQRALKDQPMYTFKELENTATPYLAVVSIGNIQYGSGYGSSKKQAKHGAAKTTLEILIPEMKYKIGQDDKLRGHVGNKNGSTDLSFFDGIKIEDPRVTELCAKTTEPLPHEILLTCLQRNFGLSQMNIKYETKPLKHGHNEFTMTVGNHTAKVICKNKRDGKQKASQAILQALHPHISSWGSLLRLYGNTSVKTVKEKKIEEQEITLLQSRGNSHSPNYAILNKLKKEMKKFKAMKSAIRPIGKFIPPDDVELPAESGSDLSNVQI